MGERRTVHSWLEEYKESHRNRTNIIIHNFCVPVITFCVLGFAWSAPVPEALSFHPYLNISLLIIVPVFLYYLALSPTLAAGMGVFAGLSVGLLILLGRMNFAPLWALCLGLFAIAWIGQFIGHAIEGKKPSFFKDLQFLLIGPLWVLGGIYRRLGIRY